MSKKCRVPNLPRLTTVGDEAFLSDNITKLLLDPKEFSVWKKLSGIKGVFFRNSKNAGLVFGFEQNAMVRVILGVAYYSGKIRSFGKLLKPCALQDKVEVFVDAVEAEGDMWVATRMRTGEYPEHTFAIIM